LQGKDFSPDISHRASAISSSIVSSSPAAIIDKATSTLNGKISSQLSSSWTSADSSPTFLELNSSSNYYYYYLQIF
jgi:hypothetical protein